jgi:hypothetical protein
MMDIDTAYMFVRLAPYYTYGEIEIWLNAVHSQLKARPADLIAQGRASEVVAVIDRLDAGVYL